MLLILPPYVPIANCNFFLANYLIFFSGQVAIRAKLEKMKEEKRKAILAKKGVVEEKRKPSALDRFKRKT